jgi:predicted aminopeptidase
MSWSSRSGLPLILAFLAAGLLTGCGNLGYYAQAVGGHADVMRATQPIRELLGDPATDAVLRKKLEEVQAIRDFASRELGLPDNDSYRSYADVGRPYVVWNVFAAPEFSLVPKPWCLLMVGCVNYRGYYDKRAAEGLAAELRQQGYDTYIGGVPAYSTLGYFNDPVLSTFLRLGPAEVARIVFHELAHQVVYAPDDSVFNESFATAVENEGLRRWLASHASTGQGAAFEAQQARKAAFAGLIRDYRGRLQARYEAGGSAEQLRRDKAGLFDALRHDYAELKQGWSNSAGYDKIIGDDLNNAKLVSLSLYSELVPAFEAILEEEHHDLRRYYQRAATLAMLDKETRRAELGRIMAAASGSRQASARPWH